MIEVISRKLSVHARVRGSIGTHTDITTAVLVWMSVCACDSRPISDSALWPRPSIGASSKQALAKADWSEHLSKMVIFDFPSVASINVHPMASLKLALDLMIKSLNASS
jgi:hypothetical protein